MSTTLRWVGADELDRVAETRLRCYAPSAGLREKFRAAVVNDRRAAAGDYLLLEQDGRSIGTTTSLNFQMWVRGARLPCQGVAYVGTIRTARRGGIANQLMAASLDMARQRGQVVSALMPFRATFYERFGYGFAERRTEWSAPIALMPQVDPSGLRAYTDADRPAIAALRQRFVERGQCDIETSEAGWALRRLKEDEGFQIVDEVDGEIRGWASLTSEFPPSGKALLRVDAAAWETPANLLKLLGFIGQQRDQFTFGAFSLPGDLPINQVLRETQLPHRPVAHPHAEARPITRLQIRILDHKRFLESLKLPEGRRGAFSVAVQECEGTVSRMRVELEGGRLRVTPASGDCEVSCADKIWASIVSGDLAARAGVGLGLVRCGEGRVMGLLDAFGEGPVPFCGEVF